MRILLINPNTTPDVTAIVVAHAQRVAGAGVTFEPVTGRFGARYIATRAAAAIAGHAALDAMAAHAQDCDAVYLACFGDPGLLALRELSSVPVIGMAEAACHSACAQGRRFGIVTGGALWGPMLTEFVTMIGLGDRLTGVRTIAPTGGEIAQDPDAALAALAAACQACAHEDNADVVILGGAALAGLAARIQHEVGVPLICAVEAGTRAVVAAAQAKASLDAHPRDATESVGLSAELATLLIG